MNLREWLTKRRLSVPEFSVQTGIPPRTLYRYVNHDRIPPVASMKVITKATGGAVTALAWYGEASPKRAA